MRGDFKISVGIAPKKWHSRQPVFCFDQFLGVRKFLRLQKTHSGGKFRPGYFPSYGRWRNSHFRIVAQSLRLAGLGRSHDIEASTFFAKPNGCVYGRSILAKRRQADVALATDLWRNRRHNIRYSKHQKGIMPMNLSIAHVPGLTISGPRRAEIKP
jgi:hypothetical protein